MQVPARQGKENAFIVGKGKWEGCSTEFMVFHWLSPCQERDLSSSCSVQFIAQLCLTLCDPMDCSTPGFPVHHQLLEHTQTHVH